MIKLAGIATMNQKTFSRLLKITINASGITLNRFTQTRSIEPEIIEGIARARHSNERT